MGVEIAAMIPLLLARLFTSAIGANPADIVCWYEPPTGASVCFVDVAHTEYTVAGVEFRHSPDGSVSVVVSAWEY